MNKVEAIIRPERLDAVKNALADAGYVGLNSTPVTGRGVQKGVMVQARGGPPVLMDMLPKVKVEVVCKDVDTQGVVDVIIANARTGDGGEIGDGKIFISPVTEAIRVSTGDRGEGAL